MGDNSRALRRIAADLAQLDIEDVQAILAELSGPSQARMVDLVSSFKSGSVQAADIDLQASAPNYSPWLEARLAQNDQTCVMSDHARDVLRELATGVGQASRAASNKGRPKGFAALLGRAR